MCIYIHRHKHTGLATDRPAHAQLWASYFLHCGLPQGTYKDKKLSDGSTQFSTCCIFWASGPADMQTRAEGYHAAMFHLVGALHRFEMVWRVESTPSQRRVHSASLIRARRDMCFSTFFSHPLEGSWSLWWLQEGKPSCTPRAVKRWVISVPPQLGSSSVSVFKAKARHGQVLFCTLKNTMSFGEDTGLLNVFDKEETFLIVT